MFKCKGCENLKSENAYLRGLVDQLLLQIAPKSEDPGLGALPIKDVEYDEEGKEVISEDFGL